MKIKILSLLFSICFLQFFAQNQADSLIKLLPKSSHDTVKCQLFLELGDIYELSQPDSAIFYYYEAENVAWKKLQFVNQLKADEARTIANYYSKALRYRAIVLLNQNKPGPIVELLEKSMRFALIINNQRPVSACYTNLGIYYFNHSDFERALNCYYKGLKISEKNHDVKGCANLYNNLANIHNLQFEFKKAVYFYKKAIRSYKKLKNEYMIGTGYNNLGITYKDLKMYDEATSLLRQASVIYEKYQDLTRQASSLANIGVIKISTKEQDSAIYYSQKAFKIYEAQEDTEGMIISNNNIVTALLDKYDTLKAQKINNPQLLQQAKQIGESTFRWIKKNNFYYINAMHFSLMRVYTRLNDKDNALKYAYGYINTKDSLFSEEKTKALAKAEALYKNEKQRYIIEQFNSQKALSKKTIEAQQAFNDKQRTIIISIIIGIVLMGLLLFVVIYFLRQNQIANRKLKLKNYQISKQKEEIAVQRDEIASQRDVVMQQKTQIEAYHKALKDSIYYAENIQKAVLPGESHLNELLKDYFLLYMPRDIVSGDFYWTFSKNELTYLAVADCTGHGVPGSLMSMMVISYLNELMQSTEQLQTNEILDLLRTHIIKSFGRSEPSKKMKDGLDIVLIAVNRKNKILNYSGANNPLYIVKSRKAKVESTENNFELTELCPDKMPVGFHTQMKPFSIQEYKINEGDMLYLSTDGFSDQFGGADGKKFMRKRFKELLILAASMPLNNQNEFLNQQIMDWKSNHHQTDDITVVGWKI